MTHLRFMHCLVEILCRVVMDETLAVANKDLDVRGFSKEEHLGKVEVRSNCVRFSHHLFSTFSRNSDDF